jgi:krueppel-like factor 6/7
MERYLKDEPKCNSSYKNLPADLNTPWDLFTAPGPISGSWKVEVDPLCLEELNLHDRNLDSLSTTSSSSSCSGVSWDSSLSCAVVVKKERIDDDYEDNSDSWEEHEKLEKLCKLNIPIKQENSIELRLIARTATPNDKYILPTLTPPSSPESHLSKTSIATSTEPEQYTVYEHQGILRVPGHPHIQRNTIVRLTTTTQGSMVGKNAVGLTKIIQVSPAFQAAIAQSKSTISPVTSGKFDIDWQIHKCVWLMRFPIFAISQHKFPNSDNTITVRTPNEEYTSVSFLVVKKFIQKVHI